MRLFQDNNENTSKLHGLPMMVARSKRAAKLENSKLASKLINGPID